MKIVNMKMNMPKSIIYTNITFLIMIDGTNITRSNTAAQPTDLYHCLENKFTAHLRIFPRNTS